MVVIPFIYRAQQNIVKIVLLFLNIPRKEILAKINSFEKMKQQIDAHFMQIKKFFGSINFLIEQHKEENKKEAKKSVGMQKKSTLDATDAAEELKNSLNNAAEEEKKEEESSDKEAVDEGSIEKANKSKEIISKRYQNLAQPHIAKLRSINCCSKPYLWRCCSSDMRSCRTHCTPVFFRRRSIPCLYCLFW